MTYKRIQVNVGCYMFSSVQAVCIISYILAMSIGTFPEKVGKVHN